ncbi:hypothetical protein CRE_15837 [Caenorhabditis remanei]|uniref:F-box domain-containing protein n=1 Tax=Caenorhabditis remanei TaxID=31234 RepID=E3NSF0_CAERE|nr:hypothetical protein CRE_15837 [Caenorhabditis remanei]
MDPPKPFPILRLPFLAIQEVFKSLHPIEIINFSMISKRSKAITQQMSFYSKYALRLIIDKTLEIEFIGTNHLVSCTYEMTSDKRMNGKTEKHERDDGYIWYIKVYKYSNDPLEEWKQLCKYVLEIFKKQTIDVLSMTMDDFVDQNVSIIDFLKTNVKSIVDCCLCQTPGEKNVDEHAAYFLENVTVNTQLSSFLNIKDKNFNGKIPKHLQNLYINCSKWIGYERLLEIDCKHVILANDEISNKEWNLFLKKWIAMETNQNLAYFKLDYREIEEFRALVLHDIPHEVVSKEVSRIVPCRYKQKQQINGGIDIRRIDGKTATFFEQYSGWGNNFLMCIH